MRRGRRALTGASLAAVFALSATAAYAGSDAWFSGTLAASTGYASVDAHSITYIQGSANANGFCVAKDQGLAGYASSSHTPTGTQACASSGGFASRSENGSCCYHGWIVNNNGSEINVNNTTRYDY